jgi:hypothetical protein
MQQSSPKRLFLTAADKTILSTGIYSAALQAVLVFIDGIQSLTEGNQKDLQPFF